MVKAIGGNEANLQSTGFISNLRIRAAFERLIAYRQLHRHQLSVALRAGSRQRARR